MAHGVKQLVFASVAPFHSLSILRRNAEIRRRFWIMCLAALIFVSAWMFLFVSVLPNSIEFIFSAVGLDSGKQVGWLPFSQSDLQRVASWSAKLVALLVGVLLSPFIIGIFAIPLCTPLANAVDTHLNPNLEFSEAKDWIRQWILSATVPLTVGLMGNLLLLFLSFLPLIGPFFGFIAFFIWSPLNLGFAITENSLDRRGYTFGSKLSFVKRFIGASWLIGFQAQISFTLPFLNLIGCPLVVMSGVKTVNDLLKLENNHSALTE